MNQIFDNSKSSKTKNKSTTFVKTKRYITENDNQILDLQNKLGNQEVMKRLKRRDLFSQRSQTGRMWYFNPESKDGFIKTKIQPKLRPILPGYNYKQKANCITEQLVRKPESQNQLLLKREEKELLQTKEAHNQTQKITSEIETQIRSLKGGGEPLSHSVRNFFELRFGYNFNNVRVHTGNQAAELSRMLNAKAFTLGLDVIFGKGQYVPETREGRMLLAHELTHVIQQNSINASIIQRGLGDDITRMCITDEFARDLTDEELDHHIDLVLWQLGTLTPGSPEYDAAHSNLMILQDERFKRSETTKSKKPSKMVKTSLKRKSTCSNEKFEKSRKMIDYVQCKANNCGAIAAFFAVYGIENEVPPDKLKLLEDESWSAIRIETEINKMGKSLGISATFYGPNKEIKPKEYPKGCTLNYFLTESLISKTKKEINTKMKSEEILEKYEKILLAAMLELHNIFNARCIIVSGNNEQGYHWQTFYKSKGDSISIHNSRKNWGPELLIGMGPGVVVVKGSNM